MLICNLLPFIMGSVETPLVSLVLLPVELTFFCAEILAVDMPEVASKEATLGRYLSLAKEATTAALSVLFIILRALKKSVFVPFI